ncbi:MAG: AbrB/MazE/SpoVT family DNA-binding domain-containing protein [Chloroflexi bacterium]|nr:AbrB/MazE/SpoVT family DNA-binding domain-containing protein [Chloroflexota bacterium]
MAQRATTEVRIGPQGRVVIPAQLRLALSLHTGDTLIARAEDGRLVLETREHILARIRARFAHVPPGVSLADELIAERRAEARREEEEWRKPSS